MPSEHSQVFAKFAGATAEHVSKAIEAALEAKKSWQDTPFTDRAAVFLRAAELVIGKYRYELIAATMLGQGKNAWQAEIDAAAELADFFRFNASLAQQVYEQQPTLMAQGHHGLIIPALSMLSLLLLTWGTSVVRTTAHSKASSMPSHRSTLLRLEVIWSRPLRSWATSLFGSHPHIRPTPVIWYTRFSWKPVFRQMSSSLSTEMQR